MKEQISKLKLHFFYFQRLELCIVKIILNKNKNCYFIKPKISAQLNIFLRRGFISKLKISNAKISNILSAAHVFFDQ